MGRAGDIILAAITGLIGLALVATVLSRNAATGQVLTAGGQALAMDIGAATAPVTGGGGLGNFGFTLNQYTPQLGFSG